MSTASQIRTLSNRRRSANNKRNTYERRRNAVDNMKNRAAGELEGYPDRVNVKINSTANLLEEGIRGIPSVTNAVYGIQDKREPYAGGDWRIGEIYTSLERERNYCQRKVEEYDSDIRNIQRQISSLQRSNG